ncbi:hypothetical protein [Mesorhizobium sp. M0491]|uniref:hypothetical protein n=1 Tax=Mesorhizobium sp. M0491 TaxID=2956950 RepID=UPI003335C2E0
MSTICQKSNSGEYRRRFTVDGLLYEFKALNGGAVTFRVIGGATKKKAFTGGTWGAWDEDIVPFCESGYFSDGRPVLRLVVALAADWIRQEKPYLFHFHATDQRKHRIYRQLVHRQSPSWASCYTHYMDGMESYFVRKQEASQ